MVGLNFFKKEYDGQHFVIELIPFQPPGKKKNDDEVDDNDSNGNGNSNSNTNGGGGNNDGGNDNSAGGNSGNNNGGNNNRHLLEQNFTDWNTAGTDALYQLEGVNTSELGLFSVSSPHATLVNGKEGATFAWFQHTVYLLAHKPRLEEKGISPRIKDTALMEWLQTELQGIIYDDIRLQGPLGPFYDNNNRLEVNNNSTRQISYFEYYLQSQGYPVGGVAIPGEENWDFVSKLYDPRPPPGTRMYDEALLTSADRRECLGLGVLVTTVAGTIFFAIVANEIGKRRAQDALWGNMMIFENAQENASYLDVGWRFAARGDDDDHSNNEGNRAPSNDPNDSAMLMEVFDKGGIGYREGDSMLLGGYEYKSSRAPASHSSFQNSNRGATSRGHLANSSVNIF